MCQYINILYKILNILINNNILNLVQEIFCIFFNHLCNSITFNHYAGKVLRRHS